MDYDDQRKLALQIFEGDKYSKLREAIKNEERLKTLRPLAEEAGAIEYWDDFLDEWKYYAGSNWSDNFPDVTDEMRREAFPKLKEERWIYWAGRSSWDGITDEMRIKAFFKLKDEEYIYWAGHIWSGITNEMRREAFHKLKDRQWICQAGCYWHGVMEDR